MTTAKSLKARRQFKNKIATVLAYFCVAFSLFWLVWIAGLILVKGIHGLNLAVFTQMTPAPNEAGGLLNAIVGSLIVCVIATAIGTPLGILTGVYLAEYGKKSVFAECLRTVNDVLLSAPSIVLGLFVFVVIVTPMGGFSAIAGAVALSLLQIPVVTRTTENMLQMVPNHLRESSAALGLPKYKSILRVTLKASWAGILTGLLLSIARIAGETGPLLFTSLNNQFWNVDITKPTATLPMVIYKFALSPYENWIDLAWAAVLIITVSILLLNLIARYASSKANA
ncbi:phosphate ABC transporter permease PstA [Psittacicella hinzii]|uniref:Phosphate transport system permease protein PstA n=1 Tax=Psittacicella hinzii TaxID=2028575 RepID=A0A3A1YF10_9GAMM|nr:phosphate ABC transporter permease PstA [Psittacicella hinzii]RIY36026.1 phosphate ABC transporter, permease protein PstA [Psittacicella hinzii]